LDISRTDVDAGVLSESVCAREREREREKERERERERERDDDGERGWSQLASKRMRLLQQQQQIR
jgi:hypothetical protein